MDSKKQEAGLFSLTQRQQQQRVNVPGLPEHLSRFYERQQQQRQRRANECGVSDSVLMLCHLIGAAGPACSDAANLLQSNCAAMSGVNSEIGRAHV